MLQDRNANPNNGGRKQLTELIPIGSEEGHSGERVFTHTRQVWGGAGEDGRRHVQNN